MDNNNSLSTREDGWRPVLKGLRLNAQIFCLGILGPFQSLSMSDNLIYVLKSKESDFTFHSLEIELDTELNLPSLGRAWNVNFAGYLFSAGNKTPHRDRYYKSDSE